VSRESGVAARVLIADDEPHIRESISRSLERIGCIVTAVDDGAPAIAMADQAVFDAVVVDYHMKTTSGIAVVRHYKRRYGSRVYCAVLSGEDSDTTRAASLEAGADEVFVKPVPVAVLRRWVTDAAKALAVVAMPRSA
jgi:two-component system OmpR family response regulator